MAGRVRSHLYRVYRHRSQRHRSPSPSLAIMILTSFLLARRLHTPSVLTDGLVDPALRCQQQGPQHPQQHLRQLRSGLRLRERGQATGKMQEDRKTESDGHPRQGKYFTENGGIFNAQISLGLFGANSYSPTKHHGALLDVRIGIRIIGRFCGPS